MEREKDAWLFARGDASIYVKRLPTSITLLVCGPGSAEHSHHFDSEATLDEFWRWYRRHLLAEEWVLLPTTDRRSREAQAAGPNRRRAPRPDEA